VELLWAGLDQQSGIFGDNWNRCFTGWLPFPSPNQQRQSTEQNNALKCN